MLRARLSNGSFILGVDAENIKRLTAGEPIVVDFFEMGGTDKVMITYGETLADIQRALEEQVGPLPAAQPYIPIGEA